MVISSAVPMEEPLGIVGRGLMCAIALFTFVLICANIEKCDISVCVEYQMVSC